MAREIKTKIDNGILTITTEAGEIVVNPNELDTAIQDYAILHGLKQKICDAAALPVNPDTGKSATIQEKFNAMAAVANALMEGEWNRRGEGTGGSGGLLFRALVRLYPTRTTEQIREFLAGKSKSEQAALRANKKIARIIDEIRAEMGEGVDTDELLNELEAE